MSQVSVFLLGGCLLHGPVNARANSSGGRINNVRLVSRGNLPPTYTFDEMIQVVELLRNESRMDKTVRFIHGIADDFEPKPGAGTLEAVDVVLLEPATPYELKFHGCSIHRACLFDLVNPIKAINVDLARLTSAWYNRGIIKHDDEFRLEAAEKLSDALPDDFPNRDLVRELLNDTVMVEGDVMAGLRRMQELIDRPMGILTFINQYMPDGRPVSWPANFREDVLNAANTLGIPVLEPYELVGEYGVERALKEDLRHYRDDFMPVVADSIEEFAVGIASPETAEARSA
ncbi:MAG: hypothetical protein ACMVY4_11470 [Minwuia sp.]|uniref:hypothetical protein n=1 Tax=Minwuia sp. TaxID=2493630 RepID=UPI003A896D84